MAPAIFLLFCFFCSFLRADVAPDSDQDGPYAITVEEYQYDPAVDPLVLTDREIEIWARLYRPTTLQGRHPVVVIMHGNHGTCGFYVFGESTSIDLNCQYSQNGTCPPGYHQILSYIGYDYIGERLATWGFIVISINANRGLTCALGIPEDESLNMARGRLYLRHLQLLSDWDRGTLQQPPTIGVSLKGKLDMEKVSLVGHSRAGEGSRAAVYQYSPNSPWLHLIPNLKFAGIFEIAGSDGQSRLTFDATGLHWIGLIAGCDGDDTELRDISPFDRMSEYFWEDEHRLKGYFVVSGSNHDFLNTEWKLTDTFFCRGPEHRLWKLTDAQSTEMRSVALSAATAFFRGAIGYQEPMENLTRLFNPLYTPPSSVTNITSVQRSFLSSMNYNDLEEVEDYSMPSGLGKQGVPETMGEGVSTYHGRIVNSRGSPRHDESLRSNLVTWKDGGFYQSNWAELESAGLNLQHYNTLSFRVCQADDEAMNGPDNLTDFQFVLVDTNDNPIGQPITLSSIVYVRPPVGPFSAEVPISSLKSGKNPTLQTVMAPFDWFQDGFQGEHVRGLRFTLNSTGAMWLSSIRFTREMDLPQTVPDPS